METKKKKRWGDRRDGRKVRDIDGMHAMMANLFPNRCDAEVYLHEEIDVTDLMKYVEEKNGADTEIKTTPFHVFVAAVAKTIYHRPLLNRFICGRKYYDRNGIILSFVVKRTFEEGAKELLLVTEAKPEMTLTDISRLIVGDSKKLREGHVTDVEKVLNAYVHFPRFLQRFIMAVFRFLDFHGMMPASLCEDDTNYSTVLLSNLGSIKCEAPYHHLNNYGTNSIMVTIGEIHKDHKLNEEGQVITRDVVNFGITMDERIADGFYFARSIKLLKYIIGNPRILENPISDEIDYIEK